jgi:hypothetical protein
MVVNFKAHGISRDTRKLARTLTLIKKKIQILEQKKLFCHGLFLNQRDNQRIICYTPTRHGKTDGRILL